jgi:cell division septum initiation protein DivIVA
MTGISPDRAAYEAYAAKMHSYHASLKFADWDELTDELQDAVRAAATAAIQTAGPVLMAENNDLRAGRDQLRVQLAETQGHLESLAAVLEQSAYEIERGCATAVRGIADSLRARSEGIDPAQDRSEIEDAARYFADTWSELLPSLPDSYGCELTCGEANAAADLYRSLSDDATAAAILAAHGAYDEEGDEHYHGPRTGSTGIEAGQ